MLSQRCGAKFTWAPGIRVSSPSIPAPGSTALPSTAHTNTPSQLCQRQEAPTPVCQRQSLLQHRGKRPGRHQPLWYHIWGDTCEATTRCCSLQPAQLHQAHCPGTSQEPGATHLHTDPSVWAPREHLCTALPQRVPAQLRGGGRTADI